MNETIVHDALAPGLARIRIQRPAQRNALRVADAQALHRALDQALSDSALRVLIITGDGPSFCAGLDLKSLLDDQGRHAPDPARAMALQLCFAGLIARLRAADAIVIAAVHGVAVGAGMGLALAADLRLASPQASFHIGAVKLGLTAGECGISYHLPRLIGAGRAADVMLTGRPIAAQEALDIGLVSAICPHDTLQDAAIERARTILALPPYASAHSKRVFWQNLDAASLQAALELENHAQVLGLMTADFQEAIQAFVQKRAPTFSTS
ncbi:enoyl-CoA hydratase/isomerase family protein [Castellaniella sp.]|uniref:enoyl-CoA hydratase/isomerase family protein n=1 Tax=Castellaniella sp. TaxID=1955812 RepID=UPI00355F858B